MTRFVIDSETLLRIASGEVEVAPEHQLVAPTLVRSQALATLYQAAKRGDISTAEGLERVTRINSLKVRFLGDKVLQRQAWKVAEQLGWGTTYDAEYVALTTLQADAFVTSNAELNRRFDFAAGRCLSFRCPASRRRRPSRAGRRQTTSAATTTPTTS